MTGKSIPCHSCGKTFSKLAVYWKYFNKDELKGLCKKCYNKANKRKGKADEEKLGCIIEYDEKKKQWIKIWDREGHYLEPLGKDCKMRGTFKMVKK